MIYFDNKIFVINKYLRMCSCNGFDCQCVKKIDKLALIRRLKNIRHVFEHMSWLDQPEFSGLSIPAYDMSSVKYCNRTLVELFSQYAPFKYFFSTSAVTVADALAHGFDPFFGSSNQLFSTADYYNNNSASVYARYSNLVAYYSNSSSQLASTTVHNDVASLHLHSYETPAQYRSLYLTGVPFCITALLPKTNCTTCVKMDYGFGPSVYVPTFSESSNVNASNIQLWAGIIEMAELYYEQIIEI